MVKSARTRLWFGAYFLRSSSTIFFTEFVPTKPDQNRNLHLISAIYLLTRMVTIEGAHDCYKLWLEVVQPLPSLVQSVPHTAGNSCPLLQGCFPWRCRSAQCSDCGANASPKRSWCQWWGRLIVAADHNSFKGQPRIFCQSFAVLNPQ